MRKAKIIKSDEAGKEKREKEGREERRENDLRIFFFSLSREAETKDRDKKSKKREEKLKEKDLLFGDTQRGNLVFFGKGLKFWGSR